jgi:hypothetical protein
MSGAHIRLVTTGEYLAPGLAWTAEPAAAIAFADRAEAARFAARHCCEPASVDVTDAAGAAVALAVA